MCVPPKGGNVISNVYMFIFSKVGRGASSCCLSRTPQSLRSSIIYRAKARTGPRNKRPPQLLPFPFQSRWRSDHCQRAWTRWQRWGWPLTPITNPPPSPLPFVLGCRSAGVMRASEAPLAVQSSWSRHGQRSLGGHRKARPRWRQQLQPPPATQQVGVRFISSFTKLLS